MFDTKHPVYPVLQQIGQEITQKVKPKAIVVFSAHWEAGPRNIQVNSAEKTDLIFEFVSDVPFFPFVVPVFNPLRECKKRSGY